MEITMNYKVTYAIDSLDTNPIIKIFEEHHEMEEWVHDEVQRRIEFQTQHSPFSISEEDYKDMEDIEYALIRVEDLDTNTIIKDFI